MVKLRYLETVIKHLCFSDQKMTFISGPRQCGKTTFAKALLNERGHGGYRNWDEKTFRKTWAKNPSSALNVSFLPNIIPIIILDEIHKVKGWKRDLKGIYDSLDSAMDIVVTGSAKLDVYRRGGDSLLGRYHSFRLHPFSLAELTAEAAVVSHDALIDYLFDPAFVLKKQEKKQALDALMTFGPFPTPLFSQHKNKLRLWQRERIERLIREDLRDLSRIQELSQIEMLVSLLPERAGSPLSINGLREDLEVAYATMKLWISYLKQIYYCYEIKPYSKNIPRSLKKEGKLYLWDWSEVEQEGARFENLIANHLLKYAHYLTDIGEANVELCYLKNKEKKEIDFLLVKNKMPWLPIEVKLNDDRCSENWSRFLKDLPCKRGIQVTYKPNVYQRMSLPQGEVLIISAEYLLALLV